MCPHAIPPEGEAGEPDYRRMRADFVRFVAHRLQSRPDAHEDLAQECLVRMWRAHRRSEIRDPQALMNTIADRVVADHHRSEGRWKRLLARASASLLTSARPAVFRSRAFGDPKARFQFMIVELFERLGSHCAHYAVQWFHGTAWAEVARAEGVSEVLIRRRWSRCLDVLRGIARDDDNELLDGLDD